MRSIFAFVGGEVPAIEEIVFVNDLPARTLFGIEGEVESLQNGGLPDDIGAE